MSAKGTLDMTCEDFNLDARNDIHLKAARDYHAEIGGEQRTTVRKALKTIADQMNFRALKGDIKLKANDIVQMLGEKIFLNSDEDEKMYQKKIVDFLNRIGQDRDKPIR